MDIEIVSPEEYVGDIISDLNARRGRVIGFEENRHNKIIKGECRWRKPLATQPPCDRPAGQSQFSMQIKNYAGAHPKLGNHG